MSEIVEFGQFASRERIASLKQSCCFRPAVVLRMGLQFVIRIHGHDGECGTDNEYSENVKMHPTNLALYVVGNSWIMSHFFDVSPPQK